MSSPWVLVLCPLQSGRSSDRFLQPFLLSTSPTAFHLSRVSTQSFAMTECPICLDSLTLSSSPVRTPCGHVFHRLCMRRQLQFDSSGDPFQRRTSSCPICRAQLGTHMAHFTPVRSGLSEGEPRDSEDMEAGYRVDARSTSRSRGRGNARRRTPPQSSSEERPSRRELGQNRERTRGESFSGYISVRITPLQRNSEERRAQSGVPHGRVQRRYQRTRNTTSSRQPTREEQRGLDHRTEQRERRRMPITTTSQQHSLGRRRLLRQFIRLLDRTRRRRV